jgi:hypothetical protein
MTTSRNPVTGWLEKSKTEVTRTTIKHHTATGNNLSGQSWTAQESNAITWSGDDKEKKIFHECKHTQKVVGIIEGGASTFHVVQHPSGLPYPGTTHDAACSGLPELARLWNGGAQIDFALPSNLPEQPDPGQLDWGAARESFFQDIDGRLPIDISIPLNIIEFGQLKRLVPGFARSINNLISWCRKGPYRKVKIRCSRYDRMAPWRKINFTRSGYYDDRVSLESLRWGLKDLASSHLAVSFGLKPLIGDVTGWLTKYFEIQAKANWYKTIADGKLHRISGATPSVTTRNDAPYSARILASTGGYGFPWNRLGGRLYGNVVSSTTVRGCLNAWVSIEPKSPFAQASAAIASTLGLNAPLSTVWDLIPFSFVADWILPVGKTIQRLDNRLFSSVASRTARYRIHHRWHTVWTERFTGVELDPLELEGVYLANNWLVDRGHLDAARKGTLTKTYERYSGWPNISLLPPAKAGWSLFASITSGALLLQRLLR